MGILLNYQYILNKMERENCPFYRILDNSDKVGSAEIDVNQDTEKTLPEAIAQIKETLENLEGTFQVFLYNKTGKQISQGEAKTAKTFKYIIKLGNGTGSNNLSANNMNSNNQFAFMINAMKTEQELKFQMFVKDQEYQKRIKELEDQIKQDKPDPIFNEGIAIMKQIFYKEYGVKPIVKPINAPETTQKFAKIAGPINQNNTITMSAEQKEFKDRLNIALKDLIDQDDNFLEHIEMLAVLSKENKPMYNMAISQLKQLFES